MYEVYLTGSDANRGAASTYFGSSYFPRKKRCKQEALVLVKTLTEMGFPCAVCRLDKEKANDSDRSG